MSKGATASQKKGLAASSAPVGVSTDKVRKPRHYHAGTLARLRARRYRTGVNRTVAAATRVEVERMVRHSLDQLGRPLEEVMLCRHVVSMMRAALEAHMVRRLTRMRCIMQHARRVGLTFADVRLLQAIDAVPFNA